MLKVMFMLNMILKLKFKLQLDLKLKLTLMSVLIVSPVIKKADVVGDCGGDGDDNDSDEGVSDFALVLPENSLALENHALIEKLCFLRLVGEVCSFNDETVKFLMYEKIE